MSAIFLNPFYKELYQSTHRHLLIYGGRGAGKSYAIADKIILFPVVHKQLNNLNPLKILVIRKTLPSIRASCVELIKKECEKFQFPYIYNYTENTISLFQSKIIFRAINNQEDKHRLKSITDIDLIWVEEAMEIKENEYIELNLMLRGGKGLYKQIISSFNPISKTSWIYDRFFIKNLDNAKKLKFAVDHNPWIEKEYIAELEKLREQDFNLWNIHRNGEWGDLEGSIYNWDIQSRPKSFDEIFYGLDFGFSVDPAVLVRVYRKADEYWVEELIYETKLTNQQLVERMKKNNIKSVDEIFADSAEPKSIEEIRQAGFNIHPSLKSADYKRHAVNWLKAQRIHIVDGSENIVKEQRSYIYRKDSSGKSLPIPIKYNDHAMDAILYAIHTKMKKEKFFVYVT